MKTDDHINNRFQSDASRYAEYLETPEGRLRLDLAFANLEEFLPARQGSKLMCALDLGCGTGTTAVRLARLGFHVTLLDSSEAMLDISQHAAHNANVSARVTVKSGDATQVSNLFDAGSFDVVLCHNVLEYLEDPQAMLCDATHLLRDSSAILSVLVRNQAGEVLKAAIQTGDLTAAEHALGSEWAQESLYGGKVRLFTPDKLREMLKMASASTIAERGVRIIADFLPAKVSRSEEYERILELERKLASRAEFGAAARYTHFIASVLRH